MAYGDVVRFDSILVLESLPPGEQKTGTLLFDTVLKPWADANPPFTVHFNEITSKAHFMAALVAVQDQMFSRGRSPILHIEAHGDAESIILANGDRVEWQEMRLILTAINASCGFNLLLVMAMCQGWWLSRLLLPTHPSPVWGVLGPTERVRNSELRDAMRIFYRELLKTFDARKALELMNRDKAFKDWDYKLETAELMYCKVFRRYQKEYCTGDQLVARENEAVAEIVQRNNRDIRVAFEARERARRLLRDPRQFFDFYRTNFFMLDSATADPARFKLTYEDCVAAAD